MQDEPASSDSSLLGRYLSGDKHGVAILFCRYRRALFGYLLRRLQDRDLAEESLQETFCRLLEKASVLLNHPRLEAWLFSVARNVSADVCRNRRGRAAAFSDVREEWLERGLEDPQAERPEANLQSQELNVLILRTLKDLPEPERKVFLLRTQWMLSFREIAEELKAPLNTVLSRMHRAMKRIRKAMLREGWVFPPSIDPSRRESLPFSAPSSEGPWGARKGLGRLER